MWKRAQGQADWPDRRPWQWTKAVVVKGEEERDELMEGWMNAGPNE